MPSSLNLPVDVIARIDNFVTGLDTCTARARSFSNTLSKQIGGNDYFAPLRESIQSTSRDLRNIVQGIILAQGFYRLSNAVQNAAAAIGEYTNALNNAEVAFGNLFNNYDLAEEFVSVLQEYAARSPFDFTDVQQAALALRAYGIESQNLMFVIEGIGNLAAVTGNYSETFSRVARAIGQINTRGKLMGEEMRQLAEAGLDVDAVYQRLGITSDNVADANIDAATAINAIVDVLREDYAGAVDAANTTVSGMLANLRDLALSIISSVIQPMYDTFRSALNSIMQEVNTFQAYFTEGGLGYAISEYFGPTVLRHIQNFIAIIAQIGGVISELVAPAMRILGMYSEALSTVFVSLLSVILPLASALAHILTAILNTSAGSRILQGVLLGLATAFVAARIASLGMMVVQVISRIFAVFISIATAASAALQAMSVAMAGGASMAVAAGKAWSVFAASLNVNPLVLAISVIAALIAALVGLRSLLGGVSSAMAEMTSFDPNNFLSSIPGASGDINKFNNRLSDTNSQLSDMQDNLEGAGEAAEKAVEGLLSFDEVFSLPDPNDPTLDGGGLGDIGGGIGDLGDLGSIEIPEIPPMNWDEVLNFDGLTGLWDEIREWFKNLDWSEIGSFITTGLVGMVGSIGFSGVVSAFTSAFGSGITAQSAWTFLSNPNTWTSLTSGLMSGIKAGLLSMGFDFVFTSIADGLRESGNTMGGEIVDAISTPISSALAVGLVTKNPFAAVGTFAVSSILESISDSMNTGDWSGSVTSIFGGLGTVLAKVGKTGLKGGLLGVGSLVTEMIFGAVSDGLAASGDKEGADIASKVGIILSGALSGASIGAAFGPIGMAVGAAIGGILGTIMGFWDEISGWWSSTALPAIQRLGGTMYGALSDAGETVSNVLNDIPGALEAGWQGITDFFASAGETLGTTWDNIWGSLQTTGETFATGAENIFTGLGNTASGAINGILGTAQNIKTGVGNFFSDAGNWLTDNGSKLIGGLQDGAEGAWNTLSGWLGTAQTNIGGFFSNAGSWLTERGSSIISGLQGGAENAWTRVSSWGNTLGTKIKGFFTGGPNWLTSSGNQVMTGLRNGLTSMWGSVSSWFRSLPSLVRGFFSGAGSWLSSAGRSIADGLWGGLRRGWNWITSQVSSWGSTLASIKGPESYDRKLLVPNGEWITSGLLTGLTKDFPEVMDVMSGLGPKMAEAFTPPTLNMPVETAQATGSTNRLDTQTVDNPFLATQDQTDTVGRPVLYVKTLIADKQGLRNLKKELDIIQAEEDRRK